MRGYKKEGGIKFVINGDDSVTRPFGHAYARPRLLCRFAGRSRPVFSFRHLPFQVYIVLLFRSLLSLRRLALSLDRPIDSVLSSFLCASVSPTPSFLEY